MGLVYQVRGKRLLDIGAAVLGLLITAPIAAVIAVAIWLDDGGPLIFAQDRIGRHERHFRIHKFRSMPVGNANVPSAHADALPITRVGRFLRRSNLDELPQLVDVLMGTMSLVGPRPALPSQVDLIELRRMNGAMAVLPGLTGLAQVNGYDGMADEIKAGFDGEYAEGISLRTDILIMLRTLGYLLKPPPRY
jgi:O-antigen biosynthesis protein WbqP